MPLISPPIYPLTLSSFQAQGGDDDELPAELATTMARAAAAALATVAAADQRAAGSQVRVFSLFRLPNLLHVYCWSASAAVCFGVQRGVWMMHDGLATNGYSVAPCP